MIRQLLKKQTRADRNRVRWLARRQWRTTFILIAILNVEGFGRTLVIGQRLQTRWSDTNKRQLCRVACQTLR